MDWKTLLAYITGTVDQELLLRNEYLVAENRILRNQMTGRVRFKPRHQIVYTSVDSSRPCRSDISSEISTQRFAHVQSVFCLCTAYLLVERRFLRHSRLHSAYM